jgi:hypothetical protein
MVNIKELYNAILISIVTGASVTYNYQNTIQRVGRVQTDMTISSTFSKLFHSHHELANNYEISVYQL